MISMIACRQADGGIGYQGELIWKMPTDMQKFKEITLGSTVVMGRKTWESLPSPLEGRTNLVIAHAPIEGVSTTADLGVVRKLAQIENVFIIGGASLYKEFLPYTTWLYLTTVFGNREADAYFPEIALEEWQEITHEYFRDKDCPPACFQILKRKGL